MILGGRWTRETKTLDFDRFASLRFALPGPAQTGWNNYAQRWNPSVLVLAEATSAVDVATERRIQQALRILCEGRTAIIIAHRLETIRSAHRIAVIENGQVVEIDTHDALLAAGGRYAALNRNHERPAGSTACRRQSRSAGDVLVR